MKTLKNKISAIRVIHKKSVINNPCNQRNPIIIRDKKPVI